MPLFSGMLVTFSIVAKLVNTAYLLGIDHRTRFAIANTILTGAVGMIIFALFTNKLIFCILGI